MAADISLALTSDEALVLHDWLARHTDADDGPFADPADRQVLWNVEALLERELVEPFRKDYAALVATARQRVALPES